MVQSVDSGSSEVVNSDYNNRFSNAKVVIDISSDDEDDDVNKSECFLIDNINGYSNRVGVIRVALESVIKRGFDESYEAVCYGLKNSLDSLWEVILEDCDFSNGEIVELAFGALKTLNKMFVCMSRNKQQLNKRPLSRLLLHVTSQMPPLFRTEQMDEIEHMIKSLESRSLLQSLVDSGNPNKFGNDGKRSLVESYKRNEIVNLEETCLGDSDKPDKIQDDGKIVSGDSTEQNEIGNDGEITLGDSDDKQDRIRNDGNHSSGDSDKLDKIQDDGKIVSGDEQNEIGNDGEITVGDSDKQDRIRNDGNHSSGDSYKPKKIEIVEEAYLGLSVKRNKIEDDEENTLAGCDKQSKNESDEHSSGDSDKQNKIENDEEDSLGDCDRQNKIVIVVDKSLGDYDMQNDGEVTAPRKFTELKTISFSGRNQLFRPLLDLHKDHDIDSLPSPTRDAPSIMPPGNPGWPAPVPYQESTALKAFSNYQQKFGQNSLYMSGDLPSPTPSEGGDDEMEETCGEVKTVNAPSLPQLVNICKGQVVDSRKIPVKSLSKSRDPRNRGTKIDTVYSSINEVDSVGGTTSGSKKRKASDEHVLNLSKLKEQKNGLTDFESSIRNIVSDGIEHLRESGITNTDPIESVLKDIAVNPTVWLNLIKSEKLKIVPDPIKITHMASSILRDNSSVYVTKSSAQERNLEGLLKTQPRTPSTDESEKSLIMPRDPRRTIRRNSLNKVGNGVPNHTKPSSPSVPSSQKEEVSVKSCNTPQIKVPPLKNKAALPVNPYVPSHQPSQDLPMTVKNQSGSFASSVDHLFEGFDENQKAAIHKERARRIDEQKKMFAARKLCLVLDLDHTLLNSAKFVEVDPVHEEKLRKKERKEREKPHRHLFRIPHMGLWTKLRPGVWNFLNKASKLFELHIYTMGNKMYASAIAKLLDPKGELFSGRVISRGDDDCDISKTKDLEGVLGMESSVVIIDDTSRVWPHNQLNLIVVERYIYFPSCRRQFGLLGPSLLEIGHDERPEAGTLASCLAVIERIHQSFFAHQSLDEADVRNILALEQRKILRGCRILFSRVFPIGDNNSHRHPLWKTAEQFGAKCTNHIGERVTHVVANSLGTEKVKWACSTGKFVVHPGWVEASALLYRRANEQDFAIKT